MNLAVLHRGPDKPLFGDFADALAQSLGLPITEDDQGLDGAWLLAWEGPPPRCPLWTPWDALQTCQDKRDQTRAFWAAGVSIPPTVLLDNVDQLADYRDGRHLLKWPSGCGGIGHQILHDGTRLSMLWQPPFLVQAWVDMTEPQVYRTYVIEGKARFFNTRRFPSSRVSRAHEIVSWSNGADFVDLGDPPPEVVVQAERAAAAVGAQRFAAVDLLQDRDGRWLVLEVNTEGLSQYILRDMGLPIQDAALKKATTEAFFRWAATLV